MFKQKINGFIDHTLLKPEASSSQIESLCNEAIKYQFYAVCVNPVHVKFASYHLEDTNIKVVSTVGFPLGANTREIKFKEADQVISHGADEIDMVLNISALKDNQDKFVIEEIDTIVSNIPAGVLVKVIIETCLLTDREKIKACELVKKGGAHYVKTSTGFNKAGASVEDVKLIKQCVKEELGVKAAGGIRDHKKATEMIEAGATRIGASKSLQIMSNSN